MMLARLAVLALVLPFGCANGPDTTSTSDTLASAGGGNHRPPGPPPKESIDACKTLAVDAACGFEHGGHAVTGTCKKPPPQAPAGAPLACVPDHMMPPPEAFAACDGAAVSDPCTVTIDTHSIDGTCRSGPQGTEPLACAPAGLPPGPPPGAN